MSAHIHINRPRIEEYTARVRLRGRRKYEVVGAFKTEQEAAAAMVAKFTEDERYKRGDVLAWAEWYGPTVKMEIAR